mmetsp:Transcript_12284/g.28453  ORF Transcript_12284/g.28453 Transcript_12284/m.28453 type:complete len:134 (-) Transcript_12284:1602-2003(-)
MLVKEALDTQFGTEIPKGTTDRHVNATQTKTTEESTLEQDTKEEGMKETAADSNHAGASSDAGSRLKSELRILRRKINRILTLEADNRALSANEHFLESKVATLAKIADVETQLQAMDNSGGSKVPRNQTSAT